jgi:hypothetical protein
VRPIIKNRFNADFRRVNKTHVHIRRKAESAGNGQKTAKYKHISRTIAETMLLYCLPIVSSYTAGNSAPIISATADRPNTGQHTETADQNTIQTADRRKYIFIAET